MESKNIKILLIEDDKIDQMAFERMVKSENLPYDYTLASSVFEAKKTLNIKNFDIILSDYTLGDGTAFDVLDSIKNTPFIFITGTGDEEIAVKAIKIGAYDYLIKDPDRYYLKVLPLTVNNAINHKKAMEDRTRAEKVQSSLYKISEAANTSKNLEQLYNIIHKIIKELIPAKNFFISLLDPERDEINFPYFIDEKDEKPASKKFGKGITEYILKTNEPLLATKDDIANLEKKGEIKLLGEKPVDWLGVPLKIADKTIGVIVVQSYDKKVRFNKNDKNVLIFVSEQIAMVIEHVRAVDEIKKSREQLRNLSEKLQHLREEEKYQMRYGIREDFSQTLAVLRMDLSWIERKLSKEQEEERKKIKSMYDLIDTVIEDVQKVSANLRPSHLDHLGIIPTIKWYIEEFENRTGIKCIIKYVQEDIELNKNLSTTLFRILEEALDNVEKHAKSKNVSINVESNEKKIEMTITDDGIGIPKEKIHDLNSLGLVSIRERVLPYEGNIIIQGFKGKGTKITIDIPLTKVNKNI